MNTNSMRLLFIFLLAPFISLSQGRFVVNGSALKVVTTGVAKIVLNDYYYLNQTGSLISVEGDWNFVGSTNQRITGISQFENLTINKTSGEVMLDNDISVTGNVTMTSGKINLNGKILDLGTTGTLINETNINKIYSTTSLSYVKVTRTIGSGISINPGNIGLLMVTTNALGSTEIRRRNEIVDVGSSNMSINRVYSVFPSTNNGSLNTTLNVNYFNSELNGLTETSLKTYRRPSSSSSWVNKGGTNIQTTLVGNGTGIIQNLNWMEFSEVTLAMNSNSLPIELINFESLCYGNNVRTMWSTSSEHNNNYFTLERSKDGEIWEVIGTIEGSGNSNYVIDYSYDDIKPYREIGYYRLLQTDFNGQSKTFNTVSVNCSVDLIEPIIVYPNPTTGEFIIIVSESILNDGNKLTITNSDGKVIETQINIPYSLKLDGSNWSAGIYFVNIGNKTVKIVKK